MICADCRYFWADEDAAQPGECRRQSPKVFAHYVDEEWVGCTMWPAVASDETGCAEFGEKVVEV